MASLNRCLRYLVSAGTLFAVWCLLSGKFDAMHLIAGAAASGLIAAPFYLKVRAAAFPAVRFACFVPWHLSQVLISNLRVARLALALRPAIAPRMVRAAPGLKDERALALLGCAVTLTPGTLTLDIDSREILVHALDELSALEVEQGLMADRVRTVFGEGGRP